MQRREAQRERESSQHFGVYKRNYNMHKIQGLQTNRIGTLAIRVLTFSSKGYDLRSMIGKRLMAKIKSCKERVKDLEASSLAYKKEASLTGHMVEEGIYLRAFNEATLDEERFLKQKAKLEWLRVGDSNSAYFHKTVKERVSRSRIGIITDMNNVTHINNEVPTAFVEHYMNFLGSSAPVSNLDNHGLFSKKISNEKADYMVREVTNGEIKDAILSIDNDKAPGPDGFTSLFFKKSWDLVGNDVCNSIRDFLAMENSFKSLTIRF
ncbi:hypothetical protein Tco_0474146 [Tanacetum coccineum]